MPRGVTLTDLQLAELLYVMQLRVDLPTDKELAGRLGVHHNTVAQIRTRAKQLGILKRTRRPFDVLDSPTWSAGRPAAAPDVDADSLGVARPKS